MPWKIPYYKIAQTHGFFVIMVIPSFFSFSVCDLESKREIEKVGTQKSGIKKSCMFTLHNHRYGIFVKISILNPENCAQFV